MELIEEQLTGPLQGVALRPVGMAGRPVGVIVAAGSSGRLDVARARLLAEQGALVVALRWFGGEGQPPGVCEVPLETFMAAIDYLEAQNARRIGIVGLSKGAEAALLVACYDTRVDAVVACAPSSVVWAYVEPGADEESYRFRSSWTWRSEPLPFVPYDEAWRPVERDGLVSYRGQYEASLRAFPDAAQVAAIPVERARADLLLIAGGDDAVWPAVWFAEELAARRRAHGRQVEVVSYADAGHRVILPGEASPPPATRLAHGGSEAADRALGVMAWPRVQALLHGK